ncbi:AAA family ATPase [Sphingobacterium humi]|uniref:AAA family ATPase n=1 Tax=Sphingobacterium humi TaxID=1796905 RepID=A0A6N8L1V7_9SPHI|nr:AAA family ATPase [Sphingobacterium humi]MVZ62138.1 AAA family ATPase [Sphingobacterium humi]
MGSLKSVEVKENILKMIQLPTEETEFKTEYTGLELVELDVESIPYLLDPLIPKSCVFTIAGASDTGKSMLFRQMAIDLINNGTFLDFDFKPEHRKVIFVSTEDDSTATAYLLKKQTNRYENLANIRFKFDSLDIPQYLERELQECPADLVIIDAWSDVYGDNLNDSAKVRQTLGIYSAIAARYQCAIGFLHHTGKRTENLVPSKNNIQGGQGFEAKMRLAIELRNDTDDSNYKHLCIVKGNYLPSQYKKESFKLLFDPETFNFTNTGDRVPLEELFTKEVRTKEKKDLPTLESIPYLTLYQVAKEAFHNETFLSQSEFRVRLNSAYQSSYLVTKGGYREFERHVIELEIVKKEGTPRSRAVKYYLSSQSVSKID